MLQPTNASLPLSVLGNDAVHVWRIPVVADPAMSSTFSRLLTADEQTRGKRYTRDGDRLRYQLGRAAMRCLLARYLEVSPQEVGMEPNHAGKPQLDAATIAAHGLIHFNLSHSGRWVVAAFARSFAVGVDIEALSVESASAKVIEYVLSDREAMVLRALPRAKQTAGFFKGWTSKEAFVKGIGMGLSAGLKSIEVSVDPEQPAQLIGAPPEYRPELWQLHTLQRSEGYVATLAIAAPGASAAQIVEIAVDSAGSVLEH